MQSNSQVMKFKKTSFSKEMTPDADAGHYKAELKAITVSATKKEKAPMLVVDCKLKSCEDEQDEKNIGRTLKSWITFLDGSRGNMGKRNLIALCESADIDIDTIPEEIESASDFDDFIQAARGKTVDVYVTVEDGTMRTSCNFAPDERANKGSLGALPAPEDDDDDRPSKNKKAANGKRR